MDEPTSHGLLERLVRLESWASHERERTDYLLTDLRSQGAEISRRLLALETRLSAQATIQLGSPVKLILAGLIVLLAILAPNNLTGALRLLGHG